MSDRVKMTISICATVGLLGLAVVAHLSGDLGSFWPIVSSLATLGAGFLSGRLTKKGTAS